MFKQSPKIYIIQDNQGRYTGNIHMATTNWNYYSQTFPTQWTTTKANAELHLQQLQELNSLAGFNLEFHIVEMTEQEIMELSLKGLELEFNNSSIVSNPIPKGNLTKHRKFATEIRRKYKSLGKKVA